MKVLLTAFLILSFSNLKADEFEELRKKRVINYFQFQATEVISKLSSISEIFMINGSEIDLDYLRESLERTSFSTSSKPLIDNTGSLVDIIGIPGSLTLDLNSWIDFQKTDQDLRPLIIHELLRTAGINDDDYLLSSPLYSRLSPRSEEKQTSNPYCNLRVAKTKTVTSKKKFSGKGFAPMSSTGVMVFNSASNNASYENAVKDVKEKCEKAGYYGFDYISGQTSMERSNSNGFIKIENKTSIKAYCFKDKLKKRSKRERRAEACQKIKACKKTYAAAPGGRVTSSSIEKLARLKKDNKCD
ncbi:MAG: hypothetical protein ACJAT2_000696 [Bacteriovoracaceae bacterium]|jgi:hypothetical protein